MRPVMNRELAEFRIARLETGTQWVENCYLVTHVPSGERVLIDPGSGDSNVEHLLNSGAGRLRHILLTHAHFDHVGGVAAACRQSGLSCQLHRADARLLRHAPMYAELFAHENLEMPAPCRFFEGEPEFAIGDQRITTLHAPGHTPGSVCYKFPGFAFTGDTLLHGSVGRTDLPGGDAAVLGRSIARLIDNLPDGTLLFPGHGSEWLAEEARAWWSSLSTDPPQFRLSKEMPHDRRIDHRD